MFSLKHIICVIHLVFGSALPSELPKHRYFIAHPPNQHKSKNRIFQPHMKILAGVERFELSITVLETVALGHWATPPKHTRICYAGSARASIASRPIGGDVGGRERHTSRCPRRVMSPTEPRAMTPRLDARISCPVRRRDIVNFKATFLEDKRSIIQENRSSNLSGCS